MLPKSSSTIVALLPIKAHSERIKGKNFKQFGGKPLFHWCLSTLLSIDEISKIVINTDARDILLKNGLVESPRIQIRDRKPEICGDYVNINLVIADDVKNVPADIYLMTHVTNPLLTSVTIMKALNKFVEAKNNETHDSLFAVNRYQSRFYKEGGVPLNHNSKNLLRTQDLEPLFEENSCLYVFSAQSFNLNCSRIGNNPILFQTPFLESFDIDDHHQWELSEIVLKFREFKPEN